VCSAKPGLSLTHGGAGATGFTGTGVGSGVGSGVSGLGVGTGVGAGVTGADVGDSIGAGVGGFTGGGVGLGVIGARVFGSSLVGDGVRGGSRAIGGSTGVMGAGLAIALGDGVVAVSWIGRHWTFGRWQRAKELGSELENLEL